MIRLRLKRTIPRLAFALLGIMGFTAATHVNAAMSFNLTTPGSSAAINGAYFTTSDYRPTGTGKIDPFLRIKRTGAESGYNTSGKLNNQPPLNDVAGIWTHDIKVSALGAVNLSGISGVTPGTYYELFLDINEVDAKDKKYVDLNSLQIWLTSTPGQTAATDANSNYKLQGLQDLTTKNNQPLWDMNPGVDAPPYNKITLNYDLGTGSGSGDMFFYLPTSLFQGHENDYLVLYSQFGAPPGNYGSDAGFEEWTAYVHTPEPSTIIAGALMLVPFGLTLFRSLGRRSGI